MTNFDPKATYDKLAKFADPEASEGLKKKRAVLLLWFLRAVKAIDHADAFEFICDGDDDGGVDAMWLESYETDEGERFILTVFQSKYPENPSKTGEKDLATFHARAEKLKSPAALATFVGADKRRELRVLAERFGLAQKLAAGIVSIRLEFVTAGLLTGDASNYVSTLNTNYGTDYFRVWDLPALAPIIEAFDSPQSVNGDARFGCPRSERFMTETGGTRVLLGTSSALDIVQWPGVDDRTLFDLNVRRELRRNKVRNQIDRALLQPGEHPAFLAAHNGITIVCREIDDSSDTEIVLRDLSVVNGAQSVIAFYDNRDALTDQLRIVVKACEIDTGSQLARTIAIRSNTQNPVNSRNLRARDGAQLRLQREFSDRFPDITYETRPDASNPPEGKVIENDRAAKLLCAVFNRRPWLAVKTLSLFEGQDYSEIFSADIHAEQVLFADRLREQIDKDQGSYPQLYRGPWVLTSIIATWLASEAFRVGLKADGTEVDLVSVAAAHFKDESKLEAMIVKACAAARKALEFRHSKKQSAGEPDDFKVDFKNQERLVELREEVQRAMTYMD